MLSKIFLMPSSRQFPQLTRSISKKLTKEPKKKCCMLQKNNASVAKGSARLPVALAAHLTFRLSQNCSCKLCYEFLRLFMFSEYFLILLFRQLFAWNVSAALLPSLTLCVDFLRTFQCNYI